MQICPGCEGLDPGSCSICEGTGKAIVVVHKYDVYGNYVASRALQAPFHGSSLESWRHHTPKVY